MSADMSHDLADDVKQDARGTHSLRTAGTGRRPPVGANRDRPRPETAAEVGTRLIRERLLSAETFLGQWGQSTEPVWGDGDRSLWSSGESCIVAAGIGVGKTTLAAQLAHARLGLSSEVLGLPVVPGRRRVLYLAMDRPRQIARALRRTFGTATPEALTVWPGPPPFDVAKDPTVLVTLAEVADADTVIVDSIKDAAVGLKDDEVGAGYNRARQALLVAGVELLELHHLVKRNAAGGTPRELEDVYGSVWITAGAGSVILLEGKAGDAVVNLRHLKQPAEEVGPLQVLHDHTRGRSSVLDEVDLLEVATRRGSLTVAEAATVLAAGGKTGRNDLEKARRKLERLAEKGLLTRSPSRPPTPMTYTATYSRGTHAPLLGEGTHG